MAVRIRLRSHSYIYRQTAGSRATQLTPPATPWRGVAPHLTEHTIAAQDLQSAIRRERAAVATKAAAQRPVKQAWRTVMPPLRQSGAAGQAAAGGGGSAWVPQPPPGSFLDQFVKQMQATIADGSFKRFLLTAGSAIAVFWLLSPKSQCGPATALSPAPSLPECRVFTVSSRVHPRAQSCGYAAPHRPRGAYPVLVRCGYEGSQSCMALWRWGTVQWHWGVVDRGVIHGRVELHAGARL